jgi:carboxylate-amine ligase
MIGDPGGRACAAFDASGELTIGLEEELMLLDPQTFALTPKATEVIGLLEGDPRFKLELPAAQLEIATQPHPRVGAALAELSTARTDLAAATDGRVQLAAAGVHPVSPCVGPLNVGTRYERVAEEYGTLANRQLVFALQVHVAPGGSARALAIYNGLRSYLPDLAALAANAPFLEGRDTGLASLRPKISELLPRQGVPPAIESWEAFAEALRWGQSAGTVPEGSWWWELRPHLSFGTLELRVPDAQTTLAEVAGVAAFAHCLIGWLGERFDAGEALAIHPSWRIAENRWRAARDGVEAEFADLSTGERVSARERLIELIGRFEPIAHDLDCVEELELARGMVAENGAMRQRAAAADIGVGTLPRWLAERWLAASAEEPPND